jgi:hypothetical protein
MKTLSFKARHAGLYECLSQGGSILFRRLCVSVNSGGILLVKVKEGDAIDIKIESEDRYISVRETPNNDAPLDGSGPRLLSCVRVQGQDVYAYGLDAVEAS